MDLSGAEWKKMIHIAELKKISDNALLLLLFVS